VSRITQVARSISTPLPICFAAASFSALRPKAHRKILAQEFARHRRTNAPCAASDQSRSHLYHDKGSVIGTLRCIDPD
jgi:hypothetical protein